MGLVEAVKKHETRTGSITMVNANNQVVARLPDGFTSGELEILRGDLATLLYGPRAAVLSIFSTIRFSRSPRFEMALR